MYILCDKYEMMLKNIKSDFNAYLDRYEDTIHDLVIGTSGGIDSALTAAIASEICKKRGIPLIGRSIPIESKKDEIKLSELVGQAFCDNFKVIDMTHIFKSFYSNFETLENPVELAKELKLDIGYEKEDKVKYMKLIHQGNVKARLRMIYLYYLARSLEGLVLSTDNQTEFQLGFWTLNGDVGDFYRRKSDRAQYKRVSPQRQRTDTDYAPLHKTEYR